MVRWIQWTAALLIMLFLLSIGEEAGAAAGKDLAIVYQSDFKGYVEGCG